MAFPDQHKEMLFNAHGVGPKVIERLEQIGIETLDDLAKCSADDLCAQISGLLMSTCWRNSPHAKQSIQAAIDAARSVRASHKNTSLED